MNPGDSGSIDWGRSACEPRFMDEVKALREALQAEAAKTARAEEQAALFRQGLVSAIAAFRMVDDGEEVEIVRDGCDVSRIEVFDLSGKKIATIRVKPVSEGGGETPHAS